MMQLMTVFIKLWPNRLWKFLESCIRQQRHTPCIRSTWRVPSYVHWFISSLFMLMPLKYVEHALTELAQMRHIRLAWW